jgi:hypothetical protein
MIITMLQAAREQEQGEDVLHGRPRNGWPSIILGEFRENGVCFYRLLR